MIIKKSIITTIDVEEWWSVESFKKYFLDHPQQKFDDRPNEGLKDLLNILESYNGKATFFILGRFAKEHPEIVEEIVKQGHQVGTHGYNHHLIYEQTEHEFYKDLKQSLTILKEIIGYDVNTFRAPSYSITRKSLWALPILKDCGIDYDSSIFPTENSRFGIASAPKDPYKILLENGQHIIEIPPNVMTFGALKVPITSGFFYRAFPYFLIKRYLKNKKENTGLTVWHNWEFDIDQPNLDVGLKSKIIHYTGIKRMKSKTIKYLTDFNAVAMDQISDISNIVSIQNI